MFTASALLDELARDGFTVIDHDGNLRVKPASRLTEDQCKRIGAHKGELLAILRGAQLPANGPDAHAAAQPPLGVVTISGRAFSYVRRWAGQVLQPTDGYLALDTETEPIPDDPAAPPPRLALVSVSSGE
jgi:hypothetical protein